MSTIASSSPAIRTSLFRSIALGGIIIGLLHLIVQVGIVFGLLLKSPYMSSLQFVASGAMGNVAYTGGLATALLGLVLELLMTIIIAGIFVVGVDRIPFLRQHVIPGSLLYGFGVFVVMNFIVLPLSAAPALPAPPMWLFIEIILEHILLIGLPLGLLVRWNANTNH
ncbi:MAG TPA: hypothetical protein VJM08_00725 [Anaerolineales bacterium]|nr:hypothetical protein [Anaerolineales bacterium]